MNKFELIKRNTQEIIEEEELKKLLKEKKEPIVYWGTAPTGKVHIGYFIPMTKIADFVKAGFKLKILIADLHAFLDDQKTEWHLLDDRSEYYKEVILSMLESLKINTENIEFIEGSEFQLDPEYTLQILQMAGDVTLNRCKRAASEVVRFKEEPKLGSFLYPLMQIQDTVSLEVDVCYSGIDQRGIYMLGRELLSELKQKKPLCVFTPMLPGLTGAKMSSSDVKGKIELLDEKDVVEKKILSAYCESGKLENNGVLVFLQYVIFPIKREFKVERDPKYGKSLVYKDYKELEKDFLANKLHPLDLKKSLAKEINILLEPIRKRFCDKKHQELLKRAYP